MLEIKSISKKFSRKIFKDFSYFFDNNNIYSLSGINGSGKTTLLKLIKGIYLCDSGEINFLNNLDQRNDVVYIDGNSRTFFHRLTVIQNLKYFASLQNVNNEHSINELLNFFKISDLQNKLFSSLSQGQMQLISIIKGLSSRPKVILLDEVFSSLDQKNKKILYSYLNNFVSKKEALVIFTSHEDSFYDNKFKELCLSE